MGLSWSPVEHLRWDLNQIFSLGGLKEQFVRIAGYHYPLSRYISNFMER
jgi:hypothetical protein